LVLLWLSYFFSPEISLEFVITTTGAILAFWYGYRRYEQDSEISIMNTFSERYSNVVSEKDEEEKYLRIIDLWYEEFFLYAR